MSATLKVIITVSFFSGCIAGYLIPRKPSPDFIQEICDERPREDGGGVW